MFVKIFEPWKNVIPAPTRPHARPLDEAIRLGLVTDPVAAREKMLARMRLRSQYKTLQYHASTNRLSWQSIVAAWQRVNTPIQRPTAWLDITGKQTDIIDLDAQRGDLSYARTTIEWARENARLARIDPNSRRMIVYAQMLGYSYQNYLPVSEIWGK